MADALHETATNIAKEYSRRALDSAFPGMREAFSPFGAFFDKDKNQDTRSDYNKASSSLSSNSNMGAIGEELDILHQDLRLQLEALRGIEFEIVGTNKLLSDILNKGGMGGGDGGLLGDVGEILENPLVDIAIWKMGERYLGPVIAGLGNFVKTGLGAGALGGSLAYLLNLGASQGELPLEKRKEELLKDQPQLGTQKYNDEYQSVQKYFNDVKAKEIQQKIDTIKKDITVIDVTSKDRTTEEEKKKLDEFHLEKQREINKLLEEQAGLIKQRNDTLKKEPDRTNYNSLTPFLNNPPPQGDLSDYSDQFPYGKMKGNNSSGNDDSSDKLEFYNPSDDIKRKIIAYKNMIADPGTSEKSKEFDKKRLEDLIKELHDEEDKEKSSSLVNKMMLGLGGFMGVTAASASELPENLKHTSNISPSGSTPTGGFQVSPGGSNNPGSSDITLQPTSLLSRLFGGNNRGSPRPSVSSGGTDTGSGSGPPNYVPVSKVSTPSQDVQANKQYFLDALNKGQINDPQMRAAMAAVTEGESHFIPKSETDYSHTSNERIRGVFGSRVNNLSDSKLTQLKSNPEAFFNQVYGGRLGNAQNEGYTFRGRGYFQLTGRSNYERMDKLLGMNGQLVANPDLANDPKIAAQISVAYMKDRYAGAKGNSVYEKVARAVGNPVASTEVIKQQAYQQYMNSGEFAPGKVATTPADLSEHKDNADAIIKASGSESAAVDSMMQLTGKNDLNDKELLQKYLRTGGVDMDPHELSWCAGMVNSALTQQGIKPALNQYGKPGQMVWDFDKWGQSVDAKDIKKGDVLQYKNERHIGLSTGNVRMGANGLEAEMIAGNEYASSQGAGTNRSQVGKVGTHWMPVSQLNIRRATDDMITKPEITNAANALSRYPDPTHGNGTSSPKNEFSIPDDVGGTDTNSLLSQMHSDNLDKMKGRGLPNEPYNPDGVGASIRALDSKLSEYKHGRPGRGIPFQGPDFTTLDSQNNLSSLYNSTVQKNNIDTGLYQNNQKHINNWNQAMRGGSNPDAARAPVNRSEKGKFDIKREKDMVTPPAHIVKQMYTTTHNGMTPGENTFY